MLEGTQLRLFNMTFCPTLTCRLSLRMAELDSGIFHWTILFCLKKKVKKGYFFLRECLSQFPSNGQFPTLYYVLLKVSYLPNYNILVSVSVQHDSRNYSDTFYCFIFRTLKLKDSFYKEMLNKCPMSITLLIPVPNNSSSMLIFTEKFLYFYQQWSA